jgi:hypothetical protein
MRESAEQEEQDTPIWGASAISAVIRRTEREAYYLLNRGLLDATKVGKIWVSSERRLRRSLGEPV